MIKIEFPSDRKDIALAIGQALMTIGQGLALVNTPVPVGAPVQAAAPVGSQQAESAHIGLDQAAANEYEADEDENGPDVSSGKVDEKGVPFNPQLCSKAAEPFYATGKEKGQWKCKKGMRDQYDAWYAEAFAAVTTVTKTDAPQVDVDVSKVWSATAAPADTGPKAPSNTGELFAWIAEMQAAGRVAQADVDAAYGTNNLTGSQLWTADAATQALMVTALFDTLSIKANA
jgi:hypothetical protein